ncbi:MAG TPA: hypothetical protein PK668_11950 [Myxococcota bacterium]|nr:hypothetical protein [Myxococcota bacterium]HRY93820.1 hypothetical protein [Myxococcota bacterium]
MRADQAETSPGLRFAWAGGLLLALVAAGCELLDFGTEPAREDPVTDDRIQDFDPNAPAPPPVPRPEPVLAPELAPEPEVDGGAAPGPGPGAEPAAPPDAAEPPRERPACSLLLTGSLRNQARLVELAFDPGAGKYTAQASADLAGVELVAVGAGAVYVTSGKRLLRLGSHLEVTASLDLEAAPAALAADDRRVVVAVGGSLVVLDPDLAVQGQCPLECGSRNACHGILLHQDLALALDDEDRLACVFRVDLASPREPKVLDRIRFTSANTHLQLQWVEPARERWTVLVSGSSSSGSAQKLASYPLDLGSKLLGEQTLGVFPRGKPARSDRLLVATSRPPWLAVVQDPKGKLHLASFAPGAKGIALKRLLPLDRGAPRGPAARVLLAGEGSCALVVVSSPPELRVMTTAPKPRQVLRQDLSGLLSQVTAMAPLGPTTERCPALEPLKGPGR